MDLFTSNIKGRIIGHIASNTSCIAVSALWVKGILHYDVLIPIKGKKKLEFASATYQEKEIFITNKFISDFV